MNMNMNIDMNKNKEDVVVLVIERESSCLLACFTLYSLHISSFTFSDTWVCPGSELVSILDATFTTSPHTSYA